MKTFDIALEYLKEIDLTDIDTYSQHDLGNKLVADKIVEQQKKYISDKNNNVSNDYYRNMTFAVCIYHLADLAQGRASFFNVACEIIESEQYILKTKFEGITEGSSYPKVMMDKFINYCNELNPQPYFLSDKSEVRDEFFMAAFHYITEADS